MRGGLPGGGLVDDLLSDLTGGVNDLLCGLIGPEDINNVLTGNSCSPGIVLPTLFKSYKSYCYFLKRQPPHIQECLTDSAAKVKIGLNGIVNLDLLLGICCENCNTKSEFDNRSDTLVFVILSNQFYFEIHF